jgi:ABC-type branched-subunit amino acid transport system substrate-binding protein
MKVVTKSAVLLCALALLVTACGSDKKSSTSSSSGGTSSSQAFKSLLPNNGPCDASLPKYPIAINTVIESAALSLKDDSVALKASVDAFNARGGVGKHCMNLTICDSQGDPNKEVDCARQFVANKIVATLSDVTSFNPQGTKEIMEAAAIPRVGISPATQELNSTVTYALDAGGTGTTFMMIPGCTRNGHTKLAAIHVDTPAIGPLFAALSGMLKAYNATLDTKVPVTKGTTDFQQFTLGAKNGGATCTIIPLGQAEAVQVLQAAKALGTDMKFSGSLGSFSADDMKSFGDFTKQLYLNTAIPPATAPLDKWPIMADVLNDLKPAGLTANNLKTAPLRSWLATYAFVTIIEKFGKPDDISKEAITAAMKAAKDVDMFKLIPPWTPSFSATGGQGAFASVSQPWYYVVTYDANGNATVQDKVYNVVNEITGKIDYPQPTAAASSGSSSASTSSSAASSSAN